MSDEIDSRSGRQLYELLPAIYRNRDGSEADDGRDLARYLDSFGQVLDGLRALLDQQLADAFPDDQPSSDSTGLAQDWVLPYLGALVDARPVSVDPRGQRAEIASAVRWRQRKGTLAAAEELTEAVALVSAVLSEGWQRVAVTARVDGRRNRAVTVDTRAPSRARTSSIEEPDADFTRFEGVELPWRIAGRPGAPLVPDSYQDGSLRTVDTRAPSADRRRGLYHPRRLLAWVAPEDTLFPLPKRVLEWEEFVAGGDGLRIDTGDPREFMCSYRGVVEIRVAAGETLVLDDTEPYRIEGLVFAGPVNIPSATLSARACHFVSVEINPSLLEARDCMFGEIVASGGQVVLEACTVRGPLSCRTLDARVCVLAGPLSGGGGASIDKLGLERCWQAERDGPVRFWTDELGDPAAAVLHPQNPAAVLREPRTERELGCYHNGRSYPVEVLEPPDPLELDPELIYELEDLVVDGQLRLASGKLRLRRVAARSVELARSTSSSAYGCLLDTLAGQTGDAAVTPSLVQLEYCTVMKLVGSARLQISDCLIVASEGAELGADSYLRWSSVPHDWPLSSSERCVHGVPRFITTTFGARLHGLLSPANATPIRSGAEDGGELGAYHDSNWLHRLAGVERKLRNYVPIGITPVLIPDPNLVDAPPEIDAASSTTD